MRRPEVGRAGPGGAGGMAAFWLAWAGLLASFTGSGLTRFGLSVWIYQETRDAQAFALLLFFGIIPLSIGALIAGPLVDRWDRRRILMASSVLARAPTLVVMLLWWQGGLELWHIYAALIVNGLSNAFVLPAFDASVRMLVPAERLAQASGYTQLLQSLGVVVGPPLAGLMLAGFGLGSVFAVDLATALVALIALALVRIPNPARPVGGGLRAIWSDFVIGLRYVLERPAFTFLSAFLAVTVFGSAFVYALSGPLVLGLGNEATIGLAYAAFGVGGVAGALALGAWGGPKRRIPAILTATLVVGVGTSLLGLRPDVVWIMAVIGLLGAAQAVMLALHRLVFQEHGAPEVLGRVFAFRLVVTAAAQAAGIVTAGSLAARVFEPAMAAGGALQPWLGPILGSGEGRGAGLMLVIVGLGMVIVTLAAGSRRVRGLEDALALRHQPTPPSPEAAPTRPHADPA
jgi:MFS transporter, DHA3 family, macrolide efflux protein